MRDDYTIAYPRREIPRTLVRFLGRLILPLLFRIEVEKRERFPAGGPLLVAGNHRAAMEAVLMTVYTPWQVEILGAADIPHERITEIAATVYGLIPVNRGHFDRMALMKSLDVLKQGGVVAVFPEGGIWDPGRMDAHTGVAWLSYRAKAPVLPIGFGGTIGALGAASRLERPRLTMHVGEMMPPMRLRQGESRKASMRKYATDVVQAIRALLPEDDPARQRRVANERFELRIAVQGPGGVPTPRPGHLRVENKTALAEFLHRPAILKIFTSNLSLPTEPLQTLGQQPEPAEIVAAVRAILDYLHERNPYLLTYRFDPKKAEAMRLGLEELLALATWASESRHQLILTPIRRYYALDEGEEIVQVQQGSFEGWM